ncbi:MAG: FUSC family protein, partial [Actinomycetota bacterium]
VSLFVLPRRNIAPVRGACARALIVVADAADARAEGRTVDTAALQRAQEDLQKSYLGNPFRASGLNARDRSLIVLVGQLQALLAAFARSNLYAMPPCSREQTRVLAHQAADSLRAASRCLADPSAPAPSGVALAQGWQEQWNDAIDVLTSGDEGGGDVNTIFSMFPDRATAIAAVRIVILTRRVLDAPAETYPDKPHAVPEPPVSEGRVELRAEASLRSPWARLALRTGLGLAIAVLVVYITGLSHGFWVVLGVTAILRFDGLTTLKMAGQAVVGTFIGAAIGFLILVLDMQHFAWLWIGLILATFVAVWAQGANNLGVGQAAVSMFDIIGFSVLSWPPDLATAAQRVQDIMVGAVVSVIVALLLWPRGVLRGMIGNISAAIRACNHLLGEAVGAIVHGSDELDRRVLAETTGAILRSQEVVDLSLSSSNSGGAEFAYGWQRLIDELRTPTVAGHLLADWAGDGPPLATVAPALGTCLEAE